MAVKPAAGGGHSFTDFPAFRVASDGAYGTAEWQGFASRFNATTSGCNFNLRQSYVALDFIGSGTITEQIAFDSGSGYSRAASWNIGLRNGGQTVWQPSSKVISTSGTQITPSTTLIELIATTSLTLNTAPIVTDGRPGQEIILLACSHTLFLRDQGTFASSNLRLATSTRTLQAGDSLRLIYSSAIGDWVEIGFTNVI